MRASEILAPARASDLAARRSLLAAALGALVCRPRPDLPELRLVHAWLDNWRGVGLIAEGMRRQGYDFMLSSTDVGWHASFHVRRPAYPTGSINVGPTAPWRAVQQAAWAALPLARLAEDASAP